MPGGREGSPACGTVSNGRQAGARPGQPVVVRRHSSITRRDTRTPADALDPVHMIVHSTSRATRGATAARAQRRCSGRRRVRTQGGRCARVVRGVPGRHRAGGRLTGAHRADGLRAAGLSGVGREPGGRQPGERQRAGDGHRRRHVRVHGAPRRRRRPHDDTDGRAAGRRRRPVGCPGRSRRSAAGRRAPQRPAPVPLTRPATSVTPGLSGRPRRHARGDHGSARRSPSTPPRTFGCRRTCWAVCAGGARCAAARWVCGAGAAGDPAAPRSCCRAPSTPPRTFGCRRTCWAGCAGRTRCAAACWVCGGQVPRGRWKPSGITRWSGVSSSIDDRPRPRRAESMPMRMMSRTFSTPVWPLAARPQR